VPELVFYRRGEEVLRYKLLSDRVVLGRGESCDVVIPDPAVSRVQVALMKAAGALDLEDLSGKGTVLSGTSVAKGKLEDGADLTLGQWRAIYRATTAENVDQERSASVSARRQRNLSPFF
jgi:two-component system, NtrC family, response regulator HydG